MGWGADQIVSSSLGVHIKDFVPAEKSESDDCVHKDMLSQITPTQKTDE